MNRIVMMGPHGSGKGTQGPLLAEALGVPHVTIDELFRDEIGRGTDHGRLVADALQSVGSVDDSLTTALLRSRLEQHDAVDGFVLDGYPRTLAQVVALDHLLGETGDEIDAVIFLDVDDEILAARLAHRSNDTSNVIRQGSAEYHQLMLPVTLQYEERRLLRRINGAFPAELVRDAVLAAARAVRHPLVTHGTPLR